MAKIVNSAAKPTSKLPPAPQGKKANLSSLMEEAPTPPAPTNGAKMPPAPKAPAAPPAPKPAPAVNPEISMLKAQLADLTAKLEAATKARAKAPRANTRTVTEILDGAPTMGDWRDAWAGAEIPIQRFREKGDTIELLGGSPLMALLAIPRDVERHGALARGGGQIAVWGHRTEDGTAFAGEPAYLDEAQLDLVDARART